MNSIPVFFKPVENPSTYSLSKVSKQPENLNQCSHKNIVSSNLRKNCFFCGIYLSPNNNNKAFNLNLQTYQLFSDISQYEKALEKSKLADILFRVENPYNKQRNTIIDKLQSLSNKLKFSINTTYLAINYLDIFLYKENISPLHFQLYGIVCLLIAAKAIELDERIPYISKLSSLTNNLFRDDEIKKAEAKLLAFFDWKLQKITLIDYLQYLLSQGIVFYNDLIYLENLNNNKFILKEKNSADLNRPNENFSKFSVREIENSFAKLDLNGNQEKTALNKLNEFEITELIKKIEKKVISVADDIIKDVSFLNKNLKFLASGIIAFVRKDNKFDQKWNEELKMITNGVKLSDFEDIYLQIDLKYEKNKNEQKSSRNYGNKIF